MSEVTEVVGTDVDTVDAHSIIESFQDGKSSIYSTIVGNDFESKLATVAAISNSVQLNEHIGTPINLANFVFQAVTLKNEDGVMVGAVRTVLIDDAGTSYATVSGGVVRSLENLVGICGTPDGWPSPITVTPAEVRGRSGYRFITLNIG